MALLRGICSDASGLFEGNAPTKRVGVAGCSGATTLACEVTSSFFSVLDFV